MKVSELTGPALDWAVGMVEGFEPKMVKGQLETLWTDNGWKPSTNWSQGGPIIEQERISLEIKHDGWWVAQIYNVNDDPRCVCLDHSPLVAAMRCYVASELGGEIEIPEELL
jgi:hypothetical protein